MADISKAEKIAAARKKLKQFQQKSNTDKKQANKNKKKSNYPIRAYFEEGVNEKEQSVNISENINQPTEIQYETNITSSFLTTLDNSNQLNNRNNCTIDLSESQNSDDTLSNRSNHYQNETFNNQMPDRNSNQSFHSDNNYDNQLSPLGDQSVHATDLFSNRAQNDNLPIGSFPDQFNTVTNDFQNRVSADYSQHFDNSANSLHSYFANSSQDFIVSENSDYSCGNLTSRQEYSEHECNSLFNPGMYQNDLFPDSLSSSNLISDSVENSFARDLGSESNNQFDVFTQQQNMVTEGGQLENISVIQSDIISDNVLENVTTSIDNQSDIVSDNVPENVTTPDNYVTAVDNTFSNTCASRNKSSLFTTAEQQTCDPSQETDFTCKSSNIENISQLSSQIQHLIENDTAYAVNTVSELEQRNQELASLLAKEKIETEKLQLNNDEYVNRIGQLEKELKNRLIEDETKFQQEINPLKEQLQFHVQTIGILVGEKTELTSSLDKAQILAKQKAAECEELQSRLKASRHRVSDLEKEINVLRNSKVDIIKTESELNKEIEKLKLEIEESKISIENNKEEISELLQKFEKKANECVLLQQELHNKSSQLSLSQLKVQQLSSLENSNMELQIENLNKEKIQLELRVTELTENVRTLNSEKDNIGQQYQQYVVQLNGQLQNLANSVETLTKENESLTKRERNLVSHVSSLEKELQSLQNVKRNNNNGGVKDSAELNKLQEDVKNLQSVLDNKLQEITQIKDENQLLEAKLRERDISISELETSLSELREDQPDMAKLVAAMESDKVAAAQAVKQNIMLKQQLEELQDQFVKFSNMKLELTEKFEAEQHLGQEILQKLKQRENELENLKILIKARDEEVLLLRMKQEEMHQKKSGDEALDVSVNKNNRKIATESQTTNKQMSVSMNDQAVQTNITREIETTVPFENNSLSNENEKFLKKSYAVKQLEERFTKTMNEVAELTEEKQRLEHLVLQLQDETETIGEYVALYQFQRGILKQRSKEKDEQLKMLNKDREEMKRKLSNLNSLIKAFIVGKTNSATLMKQLNEKETEDKENVATTNVESTNDATTQIGDGNEADTANKIIELLGEINSSNLVEPKDITFCETFHPCPLCSGKLITI